MEKYINNFSLPNLEQFRVNDQLFGFRCDDIPAKDWKSLFDTWKCIDYYLISSETSTIEKKFHCHFLIKINCLYKTFNDQLQKHLKKLELKGSQYAKQKSYVRNMAPKCKKWGDTLTKFNISPIEYYVYYICKDYVPKEGLYYNTFPDIDICEAKSRHSRIKEHYEKNIKNTNNHLKNILELFQNSDNYEKEITCHNKYTILDDINDFVIDYISDHNKNNRLAMVLTIRQLRNYTSTIMFTLYPKYMKTYIKKNTTNWDFLDPSSKF